ncbi:MAG: hypothetical protein LW714_06320 [Oxalobacteraceae bacterium]|nr:hypothetical protein [Oxalobacteraceae bacterium]
MSLNHHTKPPGSPPQVAALWLVFCLLFAQWLGYAHAINHAGTQSEPLVSQSAQNSYAGCFDHQHAGHSCTLLEAGTLGASLTAASFQITAIAPPYFIVASAMCFGFQQIFIALFSTRAPPAHH